MRILVIALLLITPNLLAADRIYTVDGVVEGGVTVTDVRGVSLLDDAGNSLIIPWYELRTGTEGWEPPQSYESFARSAMLGKARRDRGDLRGCAEMYAPIAEQLVGTNSAMSTEVFRGLLEEAVIRGDYFDAAVAMFALDDAPYWAREAFDPRYKVHTSVPMLVGNTEHRLEAVAVLVSQHSETAKLVFHAYQLLEHGGSPDEIKSLIDEIGNRGREDRESKFMLELYAMMFRAQLDPSATSRAEARDWLARRASQGSGEWLDVWCRLAMGSSYLAEPDSDDMVMRGIVELLHVLVRFDDSAEWRTAKRWALDKAIAAFQKLGEHEQATKLLANFDGMK